MMQILTELLVLGALLLLSAFFSGIETGFISLNRMRLLHLARTGRKNALLVKGYLADTSRMIGTTLSGNNLVNVAFSTFTASFADRHFGHPAWVTALNLGAAVTVLICGEFLPKLYFNSRPLERTLLFVPFFRTCEVVLKPVSLIMLALTQWLLPRRRAESAFSVTREHIVSIVKRENDPSGARITPFERYMINRVFDLQALTAAGVMTPLKKVRRLSDDDTLASAFDTVRRFGNNILPVFSEDDSECLGTFDSFSALFSAGNHAPETSILKFTQPPFYIDHDTPADDILPLMRRHRKPMGIIRNKQTGEILGIITQENILSVLMRGIKRDK